MERENKKVGEENKTRQNVYETLPHSEYRKSNRIDPIQVDLQVIAKKIQDPKIGFKIKDRRYHLRIYFKCFVGLEAVDWLVNELKCDRKSAVTVGQRIMDLGLFNHVVRDHRFKDERLFYRFVKDEKKF